MPKGLWNSHEFEIKCKKCGGADISAQELDGYIY